MRRPNFFIVGAPKCGTTSLHNYLDQHPDIFMSRPTKEPAYFCTDLRVNEVRRARDLRAYLALFRKARGQLRIGESTTWYLYSKVAAENIRAFEPEARIIIMLRNPVEAAYSLHGQFLWSCNEDIVDFEEALSAQADRRAGRRIPPHAHSPDGLQYTEVFRFSGQVRRYLEIFGPDRVMIILFHEFIRDTARVYRQTLEFLGVDPTFQPTFQVMNPAKPVPVGFNLFFARRPWLRNLVHRVVPGMVKRRLVDWVPLFARTLDRPPRIDPELRRRLAPLFAEDIRELAGLIGRDLSRWLDASG